MCHCQSQLRDGFTNVNTNIWKQFKLVALKNWKARLNFKLCQKTSKSLHSSGKKSLARWNYQINLYQNFRKRNVWTRKKKKIHHINCQTWWKQSSRMGIQGCQWNWFISVDVFRVIHSAQIQPNAAMQNWLGRILHWKWIKTKANCKRNSRVFQAREVLCSSRAKWVTLFQSSRAWFSVTEDKTNGRDSQTSSNRNQLEWCLWVLDFRQSLSELSWRF